MKNSYQGLIDDFFSGKITVQEYVDQYHDLHASGQAIDKGEGIYATIYLSNDAYCPPDLWEDNGIDIDEEELKAQIKAFLEFGVKRGYELFHQYKATNVKAYFKERNIPLDKAVYKQFPYEL